MADHETIKAVLDKSLPLLKTTFGSESPENAAYLGRALAQSAPTVSYPSGTPDPSKKYLLVNLDLDAPFASFNFMSPILHWCQTDLTISTSGTLESSVPSAASWVPPRPPPGAGPHRYVSVLYEQPEGFKNGSIAPGGEMARTARMRFDFAGFEKKAGLGKPVAGGWFTSN